MKQKLPHITPEMLRKQPNQTTYTLNQLIDKVNSGDISAKTTNNGGGGGGGSKVKLYNETGQNTDGAMTQKATTDALNNKVTKAAGKGLSTNDYTNDDKQKVNNAIVDANYVHTDNNFSTAYKTKLDGIQSGAEVNVQSDWTATDGDAFIKNKPTKVSDFTNDSDFQSGTQVNNSIASHNTSTTAHADIRGDINDIHGVIPSSATTTNQLADKDFVNSSINSVTAFYITKNAGGDQFNTKAELDAATKYYSGGEERTPTRNDYCIVLEDETKDDATTRYIYNNGWEFQYVVNETALTADQLAALNSGITASDVTKLDGIEAGAQKNLPNTVVDADYVHTDNNYTDTEKTKLSGIEEGAEKNDPDTVIDADYVHTDNNYTDDDKTKLDEIDTSKYLEKVTGTTDTTQVYGKSSIGSQMMYNLSTSNVAYTIASRGSNGTLVVSDPTADNHAATKKYVDEHSSGDVPTKLSQLEDDINNVTYVDAGESVPAEPWVTPDMLVKNGTSFWSTYSLGKTSGENVVTKITTLNGFDEYIWRRNGGHIWCLAKGPAHDLTAINCVRVNTSFITSENVSARLGVFGIDSARTYSICTGFVNNVATNSSQNYAPEGSVSTTIDGSTVTSYYGTAISDLGTVNRGFLSYTVKRLHGKTWFISGNLRVSDANTGFSFSTQCQSPSNDVVPSLWIRGVLESNLSYSKHIIEIFED